GVGTEKGGVAAINAGVDLIMVSHTYEKQIGTIKEINEAINNNVIAEKRIDQSICRLNQLKDKYLKWDDIISDDIDIPTIVGSKEHKELALDVYRQSVTVVKNDNAFPLSDLERVLVIFPDNGTTMQVEDKRYANISLGDIVQKYHSNTDIEQVSSTISDEEINLITKKAKKYDVIIVGTLTVLPGSKQITLVDELN